MGRTVGSVSKVMRSAHQYLLYRFEENQAKRRKEQAVAVPGDRKRNLIKDYVAEHGVETPEGHLEWTFREPLNIGGEIYLGFRNQRSQGEPLLDTERAEKLLADLGLRDEVIQEVTVEVADWEKLYVLHQQGKITEEQLDGLFDEAEPTWSLVVIK